MAKKGILLIGPGGHCRSCIDVIEQGGSFEIAGIVGKPGETESSKLKAQGWKNGVEAATAVMGYPIIGTDVDLPELRKKYKYALVTVGQIKSPNTRRRLFDRLLELDFELPVIISPLAYVSKHASIGRGTIVMHHALLNAGAEVGENCIINTKALVEHDAVVEDHCHISTGAIVNGQARIGQGSFMGSNALTAQGVAVGRECIVGGGARVLNDLADKTKFIRSE